MVQRALKIRIFGGKKYLKIPKISAACGGGNH